jgi:hypothetical protein
MPVFEKYLTVIKNQETTFNFSDLYPPGWSTERILDVNWTITLLKTTSSALSQNPSLPNWINISQTDSINSLPTRLKNIINTNFILYGTDYIKQFKVLFQSVGSYQIDVFSWYINNDNNISGTILYSIFFNVSEPVTPQPNTPQGIQYNTYDRLIRVEKNVPTNKSFGTDGLYPNGEQIIITSSLPAWITNNTINSKTQTWDITAPSVNTYYYYGNVYLRNEFKGTAIITLQVVESLYEEIDNCCSDENVNIVWLNRQGGRGNFIFSQRKDFNVEVGKKSTYITNDIKRYSEIKNVHNGFKVYATGISKNQIDFLDTLRYSIQCWQFINGVFIPLILDIGSFEKYNTKENMYEISMNFLYAERLNIQRQ